MDEELEDQDLIVEALLVEESDIEIDLTLDEPDVDLDNVVNLFTEQVDLEVRDQESNEKSQTLASVSFLEKQRNKIKEQNYSNKQKIFASVVAVLFFVTLIGLTLESPLFDVDKFELNNTSSTQINTLENETLLEAINSYKGTPLYRLDNNKVLSAFEEMPSIKQADVEKVWPSTIRINFIRRTPVAYINTDKGIVLLDSEGFIFEKATEQPQNIPALEGIEEVDLFEPLSNKEYLEIYISVPDEIINQVRQIRMNDNSHYEVVLSDGITIRLGNPRDLERKMAIAWSIILSTERANIKYIDVSAPSVPVSGGPELQL